MRDSAIKARHYIWLLLKVVLYLGWLAMLIMGLRIRLQMHEGYGSLFYDNYMRQPVFVPTAFLVGAFTFYIAVFHSDALAERKHPEQRGWRHRGTRNVSRMRSHHKRGLLARPYRGR